MDYRNNTKLDILRLSHNIHANRQCTNMVQYLPVNNRNFQPTRLIVLPSTNRYLNEFNFPHADYVYYVK